CYRGSPETAELGSPRALSSILRVGRPVLEGRSGLDAQRRAFGLPRFGRLDAEARQVAANPVPEAPGHVGRQRAPVAGKRRRRAAQAGHAAPDVDRGARLIAVADVLA